MTWHDLIYYDCVILKPLLVKKMINEDKKCKQYKKNLSVKVEIFSCSGLN